MTTRIRHYIPALDGVRALAVGLVLVGHSAPDFRGFSVLGLSLRHLLAQYGSVGVQVFFVLSGFLITGILLKTKGRPHYFRNFYARRGLRIWPLYYIVVSLVLLCHMVKLRGTTPWPYLLYISNLVYGHKPQPVPFGPLWSLAVEEQFYLIWPLLVWLLPLKRLKQLALAILVVASALRWSLPLDSHNTLLQLDALALGALMAACRDQIQRFRPLAWCLVWLLALPIEWQTPTVYGAGALLLLVLRDHAAPARIFENACLRFVGRISYGIYLLHVMVFEVMYRSHFFRDAVEHAQLGKLLLLISLRTAVVIGVAAVSFYLFESQILKLKRYFETDESGIPAMDRASALPFTPALAVDGG